MNFKFTYGVVFGINCCIYVAISLLLIFNRNIGTNIVASLTILNTINIIVGIKMLFNNDRC